MAMADTTLNTFLEFSARDRGAIEMVNKLLGGLSALEKQSRGIDRLQESLGRLGKGMMAVGAGMATAGAAIGLLLAGAIESAASMQDELARVATVLPSTAEGVKQLGQIHAFATQQAQHHAFAEEQVAESVYMGLSSFLNAQQAMAATTVAEQVAIGTHGDLADVMRTLGTLYLNFGDKNKSAQSEMQRLGDTMTVLQTKFAFKDMGEITAALQYATTAAEQFKIPLNDALAAISGFSAAGLHGAEAGTAFAEMMNAIGRGAFAKLGIPVALTKQHTLDLMGSFQNLQAWVQAHPGFAGSEALTKAFGMRGARAQLLVEMLDKVREAQDALNHATGAGADAQSKAEGTFNAQLKIMWQNIKIVGEVFGDALLPNLTALTQKVQAFAQGLKAWTDQHPRLAQFIATFTAISAAVLTIGGGFLVAAGGLAFYISQLPLAAAATLALKTASLAVTAVTKAWTAAQWLLDAALNANPIGLAVAGAVALTAVGYEVYEHWTAVAKFFSGLWQTTTAAFYKIVDAIRKIDWVQLGIDIVKAIASGIASAVMHPVRAIGAMAEKVMRYIPHSPAREGPFRDLQRASITTTLAATIRPEPVVSAIRKVAAAASLAAAISMPVGALAATHAGAAHLTASQYTSLQTKILETQIKAVYSTDRLTDAVKKLSESVDAAQTSIIPAPIRNFVSHVGGAISHAGSVIAGGAAHAWQDIKNLGAIGSDAILHALSGTESSYGKYLTNPTSSAIGPYQMTAGFRRTWGVSPAEAMNPAISKDIANSVLFGHYMKDFGGNLAKSLSAWHRGEGFVRAHGIDTAYVENVMRHMTPAPAPLPGRGGAAPTINLGGVHVHVHVAPGEAGVIDHVAIAAHVERAIERSAYRIHEVLAREQDRRKRTQF